MVLVQLSVQVAAVVVPQEMDLKVEVVPLVSWLFVIKLQNLLQVQKQLVVPLVSLVAKLFIPSSRLVTLTTQVVVP
tara:strand:- start:551 stop:778 length:228 start_codon:yes stop_codon:yes gene_type:complete